MHQCQAEETLTREAAEVPELDKTAAWEEARVEALQCRACDSKTEGKNEDFKELFKDTQIRNNYGITDDCQPSA